MPSSFESKNERTCVSYRTASLYQSGSCPRLRGPVAIVSGRLLREKMHRGAPRARVRCAAAARGPARPPRRTRAFPGRRRAAACRRGEGRGDGEGGGRRGGGDGGRGARRRASRGAATSRATAPASSSRPTRPTSQAAQARVDALLNRELPFWGLASLVGVADPVPGHRGPRLLPRRRERGLHRLRREDALDAHPADVGGLLRGVRAAPRARSLRARRSDALELRWGDVEGAFAPMVWDFPGAPECVKRYRGITTACGS